MSEMEETGGDRLVAHRGARARLDGQLVSPLLDLVDQRLIRVLDALVLIKRE